jgi:hypothetical protein
MDLFFVVDGDFAVKQWRSALGIQNPPQHLVTHWRRHDHVGIGNALGGLTSATIEAFLENRELVLESRVLQKFCEFVRCAIREVPGEQYVASLRQFYLPLVLVRFPPLTCPRRRCIPL